MCSSSRQEQHAENCLASFSRHFFKNRIPRKFRLFFLRGREREREEKRANCCGPREFLKRREESKNKSVSETEEEREGVFRYI